MTNSSAKSAIVYRMVMPDHLCPYGLKSVDLLQRRGYAVDDRWLRTREETDTFKEEQGVSTTPQVFIGGRRIGGHDDLRRHLGIDVPDENAVSYRPVLTVFAVAGLMALAASHASEGSPVTLLALEWAIAFAMALLAMLKLQDVESFSTTFLNYDLLARRWVPYSYLYPYGELLAGVLMISGALIWISAPVALFIGSIGAVSVFKAVYLDRRELKCACVGGASRTPLGFVSLSENLAMIGMGIWMIARHIA